MGLVKKYHLDIVKHAFSSGQLATMEKRLLTKNVFLRLLDARDFASAILVLEETDYGNHFYGIDTLGGIEAALKLALDDTFRLLKEIAEDNKLVTFFELKWGYQSLDETHFYQLLSIAKTIKNDFLAELVKSLIDLANIKIVLRGGKDLIDGGFLPLENLVVPKEELSLFLASSRYVQVYMALIDDQKINLINFEKAADEYIADLVEKTKYEIAGPQNIVSYFLIKELEIKTLRLILISKYRQMQIKEIKKRIIGKYV
ncbi:MAG: hypothetical protein C4562_03210 [Actinobacteria bacterium]|nr:MAG: hypothetical protein C4562_03210 [Actinomycetota bacterium]